MATTKIQLRYSVVQTFLIKLLLHDVCTMSALFMTAIYVKSISRRLSTPAPDPRPLPLQPQDAYGLEKLASEELCKHYTNDFNMECRVARFHNIYGPYGTWKGGREKAPAAFCRKVSARPATVKLAALP